ncbi:MAG: MFS transporter [Deltaproteobacteria bacterium]|nr:MFS transporter [Deltaproteobacteria bacterium]
MKTMLLPKEIQTRIFMANDETKEVFGKNVYYGWFILATSFYLLFIGYGMRHTFGIFFKPLLAEFQLDRATLSLAFSINLLAYGFTQPLAGRLSDRFGAKFVILGSVLLTAVSMFFLHYASTLWHLYLLYGLMGIGNSGTAFVTHVGLISRWFPARKATALAIANTGASIGQLVLVPLSMVLILNYDWRTAYLILAVSLLLTAVPPILLVLRRGRAEASKATVNEPAQVLMRRAKPFTLNHWSEAFKTVPFWQLAGSYFACGYTVTTITVHLASYVTDQGYSAMTAARVLAITGGVNVFGILIIGALADRFTRKNPLALTYFIRGLAYFLLIYVESLWGIYFFSVLIGLSLLATIPPTSALTGDFFGRENVGSLFGFITLCHQMGSALSSYTGGKLFDLTSSYQLTFLISGLLCMAATLCCLTIRERRMVQSPPEVAVAAP